MNLWPSDLLQRQRCGRCAQMPNQCATCRLFAMEAIKVGALEPNGQIVLGRLVQQAQASGSIPTTLTADQMHLAKAYHEVNP